MKIFIGNGFTEEENLGMITNSQNSSIIIDKYFPMNFVERFCLLVTTKGFFYPLIKLSINQIY